MKRRKLFLIAALTAIAVAVNAVPAKRGHWKVIKLADGSELRAEFAGDEFASFYRAEDGRRFVRNNETGLFEPITVGQLQAKTAERRMQAAQIRINAKRRMDAASRANAPILSGKKKTLVILVDFADKKFKPDNDINLYEKVFNQDGFSSPIGFRGSVRDYFMEQSNGVFDITFDVLGPVTMPYSYTYYGRPTGRSDDNDKAIAQMIIDACTAVDDKVDYKDYDWDNDGYADQVFVLYAGYGEASSYDENDIWPHAWSIYSASGKTLRPPVFDGVAVDSYACSNELGSNGVIEGIGSFCHEYSHCLGLADMYDTTYGGNYGMTMWDLMDSGNYNEDGFCPPNYTSFERMSLGWSQPEELSEPCRIDGMKSIEEGGETYIIYNDAHKDEYYMLENRQQKGWDAGIPNSGLLILHVDYNENTWKWNEVNVGKTQHCTVFLADNVYRNASGLNAYILDLAGDIYPNDGKNYPYRSNNELTDESIPAATLNNVNTDGSYLMHKPITDITRNADGTVSFVFMNHVEPTGIGGITTGGEAADNRVYGIDGRFMGNDMRLLKKGIYIRNGRKVVK